MDVLIVLLITLLVLAVVFGLSRARRRNGHVVASGPALRQGAEQGAQR